MENLNIVEKYNYFVYKHTSPSGKNYIGITSQNPPEKRWKNGNGYKNNNYFYNAIKKYKWNNFKHEILYTGLTKKEAEQKEIELIAYYKSDNREYGYNIDYGGSCVGRMSEETKKKLSENHKNINTVSVVKYSRNGEFIKQYDSVIDAANDNNLFYSAISSCCRNISKTAGNFIWRYYKDKLTEDYLNWCNSNDNDKRKMAVCQYSLNGKFIKEYESAEYINKILGYDASSIRECCKGKRRTSSGYIWRYANDKITEEYIKWCNNSINDKKESIIQYSLSGELIKRFDGITDAYIETGINIQSIWSACNNRYKTAGGYIWKYSDEQLTEECLEWCNNSSKESLKIYQYSKNGELLAKWKSAKEASDALNIDDNTIRACCRNKYKTIGGYIWRYEGEKLTEEHLKWCNEVNYYNPSKNIIQYSKDGEFIKLYNSIKDACTKTGIDISTISKCCNGKQKTAGGYIWRFENEKPTQEYLKWCNNSGKDEMKKAIIQYSKNGKLIKIFDSTTIIKKELGFDNSPIIRCCKGKQKTSYGYVWRYVNE